MNLANQRDASPLLHNMSAPPKSVVRYSGLSGLAKQTGPGGSGVTSLSYSNSKHYGTCIRFELPPRFKLDSPVEVLAGLGIGSKKASADLATRHLLELINQRASDLPLPEGCAVVKSQPSHETIWHDPLSALAVLTKCTDTVWLRAKTPMLAKLSTQRSVSLLIPPSFIDSIRKAKP